MDMDPMALDEQPQGNVLGKQPGPDLSMEGLQLMDPPEPRHGPRASTTLHRAAAAGQLEEVQQLLTSGADVNGRNEEGSTPLHLASGANHGAMVVALLAAGAMCAVQNSRGRTPLHLAARNGATAAMQQLLTHGAADLRALDNNGDTPLHLASSKGMAQAASQLLAGGAPVNQQQGVRLKWSRSGAPLRTKSDRYTPLHTACAEGKMEVVHVLLAAGAGVNLKASGGYTPLFLACQRRHSHLIEALLNAGADASIIDKYGWGLLHVASHSNQIQAVQRLLQLPQAVAAVDAPSRKGITPLYLACEEGHGEVVSLLVTAGADMHRPAQNGHTPFHAAILRKQAGVVQQLLAAGANPGAAASNGQNSLHVAAAAGDKAILQALLAAVAAGQGTPIGVDDEAQGMTALHWAVERKHLPCVEVLLAAGADPNKLYGAGAVSEPTKESLSGASVLHRAVQKGYAGAVQVLATPSNLRHVWNGTAPLHMAVAMAGNKQVAAALVAAGAPAWLAGQDGVTPLSLAAKSNKDEFQALVPAMVRNECVAYQLQQQQLEGRQGLGQQQGMQQRDLPAIAAGVVDCVGVLAKHGGARWAAACISAVMDVLGAAAAGSLVQQLLQACFAAPGGAAAGGISSVELVTVLRQGCLLAAKPPHGRAVSSRLQRLVVRPLQQQLNKLWQQQLGEQRNTQGGATAPAAAAAAARAEQARAMSEQLYAQGAAAATAGEWRVFVGVVEQLAAVRPSDDDHNSERLLQGAVDHSKGSWSGTAGLCEALLVAWWEARQGAAARAQCKVREAVVAGVKAWQQLLLGVGNTKRRG